jgi:phage terminase small subunit
MNLSAKQTRFVEEYLLDLNATQSAIRAGYSAKTANEQGARLLANVSVAAAVKEAIARRSQKSEIKAQDVLDRLARLAFADMGTYADWDDRGVRLAAKACLPEGATACVKEISEGPHGVRLKLHDQAGPLRDLARHLGIVTASDAPQVNVNVTVDQRREFFIQLGHILADTPEKKQAVANLIRQHLGESAGSASPDVAR